MYYYTRHCIPGRGVWRNPICSCSKLGCSRDGCRHSHRRVCRCASMTRFSYVLSLLLCADSAGNPPTTSAPIDVLITASTVFSEYGLDAAPVSFEFQNDQQVRCSSKALPIASICRRVAFALSQRSYGSAMPAARRLGASGGSRGTR